MDRRQTEIFLSLPQFAQRHPDCEESTATVETAELDLLYMQVLNHS